MSEFKLTGKLVMTMKVWKVKVSEGGDIQVAFFWGGGLELTLHYTEVSVAGIIPWLSVAASAT